MMDSKQLLEIAARFRAYANETELAEYAQRMLQMAEELEDAALQQQEQHLPCASRKTA